MSRSVIFLLKEGKFSGRHVCIDETVCRKNHGNDFARAAGVVCGPAVEFVAIVPGNVAACLWTICNGPSV
jgi:hypothetical protein